MPAQVKPRNESTLSAWESDRSRPMKPLNSHRARLEGMGNLLRLKPVGRWRGPPRLLSLTWANGSRDVRAGARLSAALGPQFVTHLVRGRSLGGGKGADAGRVASSGCRAMIKGVRSII